MFWGIIKIVRWLLTAILGYLFSRRLLEEGLNLLISSSSSYIEGTLLSNMEVRWVWDLNGEGVFRVKDVRILLDECFLPKAPTATRWVNSSINIKCFYWRFSGSVAYRYQFTTCGVLVSDLLCPLCSFCSEIPRTCFQLQIWLRISSDRMPLVESISDALGMLIQECRNVDF
ncbi:hypothetical protein Tco_0564919 [Tanacetum coccineum]